MRAPTSVRRDPPCPPHLPRDRGPGRQHGSREHPQRQGRPQPLAWQAPTVRGSAINPVDHPHGGGEGKSKGGRNPVTPWGVPTWQPTREHKESNQLIVRGRPAAARKGAKCRGKCFALSAGMELDPSLRSGATKGQA